jgi:hypothetical protein
MADWWKQTQEQVERFRKVDGSRRTPVLFYTKARAPWRVRMMGAAWDESNDVYTPCIVDISAESFENYFIDRCRFEFSKLKHRK